MDAAQQLLEENSKALNLVAERIQEEWEMNGEDGQVDGEEIRQIVEECRNNPAPSQEL